jgi:dTDP-4-dehydrorhamnose 3,5-epimerase
MPFRIEDTPLQEVKLVIPDRFKDHRGYFSEIYHADRFQDAGLPAIFKQVNCSGSVKNVIRGLHFQWDPPMGKLMRVIRGEAFIVAVDIRRQSPTRGKWFGLKASSESGCQLWAPACFARGFCVTSDYAEIEYLCTGAYNSAGESGIQWNDPDIGIDWPVRDPVVSEKDCRAQTLREWLEGGKAHVFDSF